MIYSEAAYFDGAHVQHIADWHDHKRRERIWNDHRAISRLRPIRVKIVDIEDEEMFPEFAAARRYLEGKGND